MKVDIKKNFASLCSSVFLFSLVNVNAMESSPTVTSRASELKVTDQELNVVKEYTGSAANLINSYLRGENSSSKHISHIEDFISNLSSYIEKTHIKEEDPILLYKGIKKERLDAILKSLNLINAYELNGKNFIDKAFMSTSIAPRVAVGFCGVNRDGAILKIEIGDIKKVKVSDLRDVSDIKEEKEFLFDKGHTVIIKKIIEPKDNDIFAFDNNILIIECDIVYNQEI